MEEIYFDLLGVRFSEPATAITNVFLAIQCLVIAYYLGKLGEGKAIINNWKRYYFITGISNFIAVVVHGLLFYVMGTDHTIAWVIMNFVATLAVYFVVMGTVQTFFTEEQTKSYNKLIIAAFLDFFIAFLFVLKFVVIMVCLILSMGFILVINAKHYFKTGRKGSGWIVAGLSMLIFAGAVHATKYDIHPWFNYNAMAHIFISINFALVYKGIKMNLKNNLIKD